MTQCKAKKVDGSACSRTASEDGIFCKQHINYRKKYWKDIFGYWLPVVLSVILFFISTILAYHFFVISGNESVKSAEKSLNYTAWSIAPVILSIVETLDDNESRWNFTVTNSHPLKETGTIYLYRLEINPNKPHMALKGLKPGESNVFSLTFRKDNVNVTFSQQRNKFGGCSLVPPAVQTYFVNDHISIGVKITCDNCPSQGITRRLPNFETIDFVFAIGNDNCARYISIPRYEWTDYLLEQITK